MSDKPMTADSRGLRIAKAWWALPGGRHLERLGEQIDEVIRAAEKSAREGTVSLAEVARAHGLEEATRECPYCVGVSPVDCMGEHDNDYRRIPLTLAEIVEAGQAKERERCRVIAKMGHEEDCDCMVCHDVAAVISDLGPREEVDGGE